MFFSLNLTKKYLIVRKNIFVLAMKVLVVIVVLLFMMDYISAWIVLTWPSRWYWLGTPFGMLQTFTQGFVFAMAIYSYCKVVSTPPGNIPAGWVPSGFSEEELEEAIEISTSKEKSRERNINLHLPRYCSRCQRFKPPRAYHCSICKTCTPRMDHHCPWINNCVGNNNQKLFFVFLFWGGLGILYTLAGFTLKLLLMFYSIYQGSPEYITVVQGLVIIANYVVFGPFLLGITSLLFFQQSLAIQNITTVEFKIRRSIRLQERKLGLPRSTWPYNLGPDNNLLVFFGKNPFLWLLPALPDTLSDGIHFENAESDLPKAMDSLVDV